MRLKEKRKRKLQRNKSLIIYSKMLRPLVQLENKATLIKMNKVNQARKIVILAKMISIMMKEFRIYLHNLVAKRKMESLKK